MKRSPDTATSITVRCAPADFADWEELLTLLHAAFASQEARIDPPSSLHRLDVHTLAAKARDEQLFLAFAGAQLVGCIFARPIADAMFLGKHAVLPRLQGGGVGARLMAAAEAFARRSGYSAMVLETRIELTENHETYAALGFVKTADRSHEGYARPTFVVMRKALEHAR